MPNYRCSVCYKEFYLPRKEHKLLIKGMEKFCTISCIEAFIFGLERTDDYTAKTAGILGLNEDGVWDCITKKWYRSWYEVYVSRFFSINSIYAEYESIAFQTSRGKYIPDFRLPEFSLLVEVKGLWSMSAKAKFKDVISSIEGLGYRMMFLPSYLNKQFREKFKHPMDSKALIK